MEEPNSNNTSSYLQKSTNSTNNKTQTVQIGLKEYLATQIHPQFSKVADLLYFVGDNMRYQKIVLVVFSLMSSIIAFVAYEFPFIFYEPTFMCIVDLDSPYACSAKSACSNPMGYYIVSARKSIITEYSLYCEKEYLLLYGKALFLVAGSIGSIILIVLTNTVGRLPILYASGTCLIIGTTISYFAKNYKTMFVGLSFCSISMTSFIPLMNIYMNETIGKFMRLVSQKHQLWYYVHLLRFGCSVLYDHKYLGNRL